MVRSPSGGGGGGTPAPPPTPYANPFRRVTGLSPERIDMGADYAGSGPVFAIAPGVITEADTAWAGAVGAPYPGTFIAERITQGPAQGQYWYTAEDLEPSVSAGQHVDTSTQIGTLRGGLETGWAAGPTGGLTLAASLGQQAPGGDPGAWSTAAGLSASRLLQSTGAPPGILGSGGPHGTLPSGFWPALRGPVTKGGGTGSGGGSGGGGGGAGGGPVSVLSATGQGGLAGILGSAGSIIHGLATMLDWLFGFWYPGQGWRIVFGAGAVLAGTASLRSWQSAGSDTNASGFPLAVALMGAAALGAFIALRPWPMVGQQPVKPGAYVAEVLEGRPPVAGQARPHDVTGIEIGLGVLAGAWLASKVAGLSSGILDFLAGLGAAAAGKGAPTAPIEPAVPPPVEAA